SEEVKALLPPIKDKFKLTRLEIATDSENEDEETDHVVAEINPKTAKPPKKKKKIPTGNTPKSAIPLIWYKDENTYEDFPLPKIHRSIHPHEATYLELPPVLPPEIIKGTLFSVTLMGVQFELTSGTLRDFYRWAGRTGDTKK